MLGEAISRTLGDRSIAWKAPVLGFLAVSGIGTMISLGHSFAVQQHVFDEEEGSAELDLEQAWPGLRFLFALLVLAVPAYAIVGNLLVPPLIDAGLSVAGWVDDPAATGVLADRLPLFVGALSAWALLVAAIVPGLMANFAERGTRFTAALDLAGTFRLIRRAPGEYAGAVLAEVLAVATSVAGWLLMRFVTPSGSGIDSLAGVVLGLPLLGAGLLLIQAQVGVFRRVAHERDPYREYTDEGWHHLRDQREGRPGSGGFVSDKTPESPVDERA